MRTIYVDSEFKCHLSDDGTMTEIQTDLFYGKCGIFVEGYCHEPDKGKFYPWKPFSPLYEEQRKYEKQLLAEYAESLITMGVKV